MRIKIERGKKTKKDGDFSKKVVVFVILANVLFSIANMYVFLRTGSEPGTLVASWFTFTTGELWALSKITRDEKKSRKDEEE